VSSPRPKLIESALGFESALLSTGERRGGGLLHPGCDLEFIEIIEGLQLDTRVCLPMPIGVTGGSGSSSVPRMNISFTLPTKAPDAKHQPPPTP
jgi:hypothetical protein